ncbi:MAG: molecular chaperone DnaJ, partial [Leptospiraceae bacterium]|nr:molecular chaperone DnaJ [Leptospiraceae bacterium]
IKRHPTFERQGNDLVMSKTISMVTACLGGDIEVPTIEGKNIKMKVPEGTEPGQVFRLKGHGIPYLGSYGKGDQHVVIKVEIPKKLTKRQRELLMEFDQENDPSLAGGFFKGGFFKK